MPGGDECLEIQLPPGLERPRWLISHKLVKNAIRKDGHRDAAGQLALQNEAAGIDSRQVPLNHAGRVRRDFRGISRLPLMENGPPFAWGGMISLSKLSGKVIACPT